MSSCIMMPNMKALYTKKWNLSIKWEKLLPWGLEMCKRYNEVIHHSSTYHLQSSHYDCACMVSSWLSMPYHHHSLGSQGWIKNSIFKLVFQMWQSHPIWGGDYNPLLVNLIIEVTIICNPHIWIKVSDEIFKIWIFQHEKMFQTLMLQMMLKLKP